MTKISNTSSAEEKVGWLAEIFACTREVRHSGSFVKWDEPTLLKLFNLIDSKNLLPEPDIVYEARPYKTTEQERELAQAYRERQKRLKEKQEYQEKLNAKKEHALEREKGLCWRCSKMVKLLNKQIKIRQKPSRNKKQMDLVCNCAECNQSLRLFAGWYSV